MERGGGLWGWCICRCCGCVAISEQCLIEMVGNLGGVRMNGSACAWTDVKAVGSL